MAVDDKLLDPTLIGVIIGSSLSLIGNVITQYFSNRKEEKQWERQRITSKEEREEKNRADELKHVRELYHKCVLSLSVYMTNIQQNEEEGDDKRHVNEINDIHHWLSLLLLRHPHKKLSQLIDNFLYDPDEYDAENLRKYVLELVEHEKTLDSPDRIKETLLGAKEAKNKGRTISFRISEAYRRKQMVSGMELPQSHSYAYELESLTDEQRERLLKVYFQSHKRIPDNAQLYLPVHNLGAEQINFRGKQWEAEVDPALSSVREILDLWGMDFDKHLEVAEQNLGKNA